MVVVLVVVAIVYWADFCPAIQGDSRSTWVDSPLVTAARNGWICVLDGIGE